MSNDTESNFNLDLQEHFLTSFHNGMRDFAKELDKKREVKVLESVKKMSKEEIQQNLQSFYDYIHSMNSIQKVIAMDITWITEASHSGVSMLSFVPFSDIENIMADPKAQSGIWKYIHLFLLLSMQYLQVNSDFIQELTDLLKPTKGPKKSKSSRGKNSKLDFESLRTDPFLRKLEESKIGKMAKELAQSMNFEEFAKQFGGIDTTGNDKNPIGAILENMTKNPEMLKSMISKIGDTVKTQLSRSEMQGQDLKDEVQDIMSSLKESPVVNGIMENIGPLAGNGSNPLNIVKGMVSSLTGTNTKGSDSTEEGMGGIESLSEDLEQMWQGESATTK